MKLILSFVLTTLGVLAASSTAYASKTSGTMGGTFPKEAVKHQQENNKVSVVYFILYYSPLELIYSMHIYLSMFLIYVAPFAHSSLYLHVRLILTRRTSSLRRICAL